MLNRYLLPILAIVAAFGLAPSGARAQQSPPTYQQPRPTLTQPIVITRPMTPTEIVPALASPDVATPVYGPTVSGLRGVLVESLDGQVVLEQTANETFNPASAVKLATALTALRNFGPHHRFITAIWTNGTLDKTTGTITGDLIVAGRDPSFHYEHAVMLAAELNRLGVRMVTGDLIVAPRFTMNFDWSSQRSGDQLYDTLDATRRTAAATRAWLAQRAAVGDTASLQSVPSVIVMGAVYVDSVPPKARMLLTHQSSKLIDVLKVLLCYSNNFMAERIGDTLGGPDGVRRSMVSAFGVNPAEIHLASTSGLGVNRLSARVMMRIFRALRDELAKYGYTSADIMPVAGIDPGTLEKRYTSTAWRGSVIAKTGTLIRTDGGASSLVGQMRTASGQTLLFVIFNMHGNVLRFREYQDSLVTQLQSERGGPAPFTYRAQPLSIRLASTQLNSAPLLGKDEYEPGTN